MLSAAPPDLRSQATGRMLAVAFSTRPESQTLAGLQAALAAHGYLVSQKARVLDVIEAAAANFGVKNPYPPARRLAERLARRHGFACNMLGARSERPGG
jgi:hypothetical protein